MAIIGTFTREETGFTGTIETLTFKALVAIEPTQKRSEKSPDCRVYTYASGPGEIGAAWKKTRDGKEHLSVRIDDPSLPAPINCRLVKTGAEHGYSLIWERKA